MTRLLDWWHENARYRVARHAQDHTLTEGERIALEAQVDGLYAFLARYPAVFDALAFASELGGQALFSGVHGRATWHEAVRRSVDYRRLDRENEAALAAVLEQCTEHPLLFALIVGPLGEHYAEMRWLHR